MMLLNDLELASVLDPVSGLRLSAIELPEVLFLGHPERRYVPDGVYGSEDAENCRRGAEKVVKEMVRLHLDGFL